MSFSLILATIGRVEEPRRFLESLALQEHCSFELFVVDQNRDDRLDALIGSYSDRFPVHHLRSTRGLSRARNVALPLVTGDIIGFPDDDCWYPRDLLSGVAKFLSDNQGCAGVTGRPASAPGVPQEGWDGRRGWLTRSNVWKRGISFTIFLREQVVKEVGQFDEGLGVGSGTTWGSGEETDYLLTALGKGFSIYYDPDIQVFHPASIENGGVEGRKKTHSYAMGMGHVLRKHKYPLVSVAYFIFRPLVGALLHLTIGAPPESGRYWVRFTGRVAGYTRRSAAHKER